VSARQISFQGEIQFRRYSDTSTQGVQVVFALADRSDLESFIGKEGRRYMAVLVELTDTDEPVQEPVKLGPICREAIDLCGNGQFQEYAVRSYRGSVPPSEKVAKQFILTQCNVDSRKDLDTAEGARDLFIEHVRKPFHAWLAKQAVPPTSGAGY
jgi:hypothetical protein